MPARFQVVKTNPNKLTGGGGCLCSPGKHPDQDGPYIVFTATEMEDLKSPQPVLCAHCVKGCVKLLGEEPEPVIEAEAEEIVEDDVPRV